MGRICPILNHPLNDGVLIQDDALVNFIQKRNLDFLPNELVCRSCKREVTKLYNKKLKRAIELHRSRFHEGSISSLKTSKISSSSSTTSERSLSLIDTHQRVQVEVTQNGRSSSVSTTSFLQQNGCKTNSLVQNNDSGNSSKLIKTPTVNIISVSQTSIRLSTSISNTHSILQENQKNQTNLKSTTPAKNDKDHVTIRKRTIKDFLTVIPATSQPVVAAKTPAINKSTIDASKTNDSAKRSKTHIVYDSHDEDDVVRRLSQQPTTSKKVAITSRPAVNSNKRPISAIVDSEDDDDDERLSLNAFNGMRLPHIQPLPPKRKSNPITANQLGRDIMDEYIKDITGG